MPFLSNNQLDSGFYRSCRSSSPDHMCPQQQHLQQMPAVAFEGASLARKRVVLRVLALVFVFDPYLAEGQIDSVVT